jgi:hypothetical protein
MRQVMAALSIAGLLGASPVLAATPPAPAASPATAPDPALVFYPPAARAAGVQGQVVLSCVHDAHLALKNCTLVSETPAGQGFGAAALTMAAQSPENPKVDLPDVASKPPAQLTIRFTLGPPQIIPDVTRMGHVVDNPGIVSQPTAAQIQAAYPERALANQIEGAAAMDCQVGVDGKLSSCAIAGELPSGFGFGQAALDLAGDFLMKPRAIDREPVGGAIVRVGVSFRSSDAAAPLSLDTKPAKP